MPSHHNPIRLVVATTLIALLASVTGALVAPASASGQIQEYVCQQGELVGDQCRIVGPAPQCVSPAQGTPPDCYVTTSPTTAPCARLYTLQNGICVAGGVGSITACPPTGGPPATLIIPPATTAVFWRCEYIPPLICPSGYDLVGTECRRPVAPSCPDPFELEGSQCVRYVPADVIIIPGKVTVTYGAECGPDGRVGLVNIQIVTENGATVAAITINGSPNTSTRVDPGSPINVAVITNEPSDEIVVNGPTTAPICAAPTPTPRPTTPPTTPTPTPTATPTPTPDVTPVLAASVTPGECVGEAERSVVLTASLSPSSATDLVQWRVDGAPVAGPETPGTLNVTVVAGGPLEFEAEVLDPAEVAPFADIVEIERCEAPGEPSVEVGPCDADGLRELILLSTTGDEVQWFVDGEPVGPPAPPGPLMGSIVADGAQHVVELVVLSPPALSGLTETVVVEPCERTISLDVQVGECVEGGRSVTITTNIEPSVVGDLVQLRVDGAELGAPAAAGTRIVVVADDDADHSAAAELVEPATGETASTTFTVEPCPRDPISISATTLRQHGRSEVVLPPECVDATVELPGVDQLVPVRTGDQGQAVFTTDSTTLPVGEHLAAIDCAGTPVEVTIFVYHQIGGSRGESRGVTVASALGLAGLALVGAAQRRFW